MICPVCGNNEWAFERRYTRTDKYEDWCGIPGPVNRSWYKCEYCGLMKVLHSYPPHLLEPIYTNGYRAKNFRGGSIEEEFKKIINLPLTTEVEVSEEVQHQESENRQRVNWVKQFLGTKEYLYLLDIGAGLGVFLAELFFATGLKDGFFRIKRHAVEPNKDSCVFLNNSLEIPCIQSFYKPGLFKSRFDWITCIHVLEHQKKPEDMLLDFHEDLKPGGKIFLEVPDACEFEYLPDAHDEFNSTHLYFFSPMALITLVESCGYHVTDMKRVRTKARDLSRIMMVAECKS